MAYITAWGLLGARYGARIRGLTGAFLDALRIFGLCLRRAIWIAGVWVGDACGRRAWSTLYRVTANVLLSADLCCGADARTGIASLLTIRTGEITRRSPTGWVTFVYRITQHVAVEIRPSRESRW